MSPFLSNSNPIWSPVLLAAVACGIASGAAAQSQIQDLGEPQDRAATAVTVGVLGANHWLVFPESGERFRVVDLLSRSSRRTKLVDLTFPDELGTPVDLVIVPEELLEAADTAGLRRVHQRGAAFLTFGEGHRLQRMLGLASETGAEPGGAIGIFATRPHPTGRRSDLQIVVDDTASLHDCFSSALAWVVDQPASPPSPEGLGSWILKYDFQWLYYNSSTLQHRFNCFIFRLDDSFSSHDYYLVHCDVWSKPNSYTRSYSRGVGWYTYRRYTKIDVDYYDNSTHHTELIDHQPPSTISSASVGYSIGGGLNAGTGGAGGSVSGSKSWSWTKSDIEIRDKSDYYYDYGRWEEKFINGPGYGWYPTSITGGPSASASSGSEFKPSLLMKTTGSRKGIKCRVLENKSKMRKDSNFRLSWWNTKWDVRYTYGGTTGSFWVNW